MATGQQFESGDDPEKAQVDEQITQLFRDHYARVYRLVRRKGFSEADAAEIMNISVAAVNKRLVEKGPVRGKLVAYFTKVVQNQVAQRKRDEASHPVELRSDEFLAARPTDSDPQLEADPAPRSPEREAWLRAALSAVDGLPSHLKEPYELEVYEELKPKEIARRLGKRPGTIRVYLSMADDLVKERTAELLQAEEDEREGNDDE
jgi:RNA polymerase sigma factor (sigma-70 family)